MCTDGNQLREGKIFRLVHNDSNTDKVGETGDQAAQALGHSKKSGRARSRKPVNSEPWLGGGGALSRAGLSKVPTTPPHDLEVGLAWAWGASLGPDMHTWGAEGAGRWGGD